MSFVTCSAVRPRFARGAPVMIPVPRERVGLPVWVAPEPVEAPAPAPARKAAGRPPRRPVAPVPAPAVLPRAPLALAPVEPSEATAIARPVLGPILRAVSDVTGFSVTDLKAPGRSARIARARHIAFFVIRRFTGRSLPSIGQAFSGRDHTTVLHGCRKVDALVKLIGEPASDTVEGWAGHLAGHDWKTGKELSR